MDLIERYLAYVRLLLPRRSPRDDILAELREALTVCQEEQATKLGRSATPEEAEQLLREFGHPVIVAARYGRQQYLIGPDLYPVYTFVLKLVLLIVAAAIVLSGIVTALATTGAAGSAARTAIALWSGAFSTFAAVTIIFAALQRYFPRLRLLSDWRARDLPALPKARRGTWFEHVTGIVVNAVFILWWLGVIRLSPLIPLNADQGLHLSPDSAWHGLYWPVLGLAFGAIAIHGLRLMRDENRRLGHALDLTLQLGFMAVAGWALHAGHWIAVTGTGLPPEVISQIDRAVNLGLATSLIVILCVAAVRAGYDVWRLAADGDRATD